MGTNVEGGLTVLFVPSSHCSSTWALSAIPKEVRRRMRIFAREAIFDYLGSIAVGMSNKISVESFKSEELENREKDIELG